MARTAEELGATDWPPLPDTVQPVKEMLHSASEPAPVLPDMSEAEEKEPLPADLATEAAESAEGEWATGHASAQEKPERSLRQVREAEFGAPGQGSARSWPTRYPRGDTETKRNVEEAAMERAQEWLRDKGFEISDVSHIAGLGYDLEAKRGGEVRFVEVKGLSQRGPVAMTESEWNAAQQYGEAYWLFVFVVEENTGWILSDPVGAMEPSPRIRREYILHDIWDVAQKTCEVILKNEPT